MRKNNKRNKNTKRKKNNRSKNTKSKMNIFNKYFDKVFVINLFDNVEKWKKVNKQFKNRNINVERFVAVDGRCKNTGKQSCLDKLNSFKLAYNVDIDPKQKNQNNKVMPLKEIVPASSLSIGTLILLRSQVKYKWKHMLLCEDDIELTSNLEEKFKNGIDELKNKKWDLLYLGCGGLCGNDGLSLTKDKLHKYSSVYSLPEIGYIDELYLKHPNDLRMYRDNLKCDSNNLVKLEGDQGGTWCYAWSLQGARKMLKIMEKNNNLVSEHIDQIIAECVRNKKLTAYSFNPVIVHHELLQPKRKTDIPWKW
jgi:GR25 family glycosyltransferase involved in LPS biosynthesis